MNDQPTPDALSRASAYLDGELDASDVTAAEADPDVMAEVARLRSLRDQIRDVAGPNSYARDMAVAAALAEFDTLHQPAVPIHSGRRPNYGRWMAVAAAIAGVAALGAVITTAGRGGDSDSAELDAAAESAVTFDTDAADRAASVAGAPAPDAEAAQSQTMIASEPPASEAPAVAEAGGAGSAESAATTAASATTAAASDAFVTPFDPGTPIRDASELGRIGRQLLTEWTAGGRESMSGTACDGTPPDVVLLSDALLIVDGASRAVLVAANPQTDETVALDPVTCAVVANGL